MNLDFDNGVICAVTVFGGMLVYFDTSLGVKVVREPPHKGNIPAIGRNYGAKIAEGEILAFLDADCFPEKKMVNQGNRSL